MREWLVRASRCIEPHMEYCIMMTAITFLFGKIKFGNPVLHWLGRHVFSVYMYHMLFCLVFMRYYTGEMSELVIVVLPAFVIIGTCCVCRVYDQCRVRQLRFRGMSC